MATQSVLLEADTPVDIVNEFSLTSGSTYLLQVVGSTSIKLSEQTAAPDTGDRAHSVRPSQTWAITVGSDPIYVWCRYTDSAIAITETQ